MEDKVVFNEEDIFDHIKTIRNNIRLDIGVKMDCPGCNELAVSARQLAALSPRITVHLLDLGNVSRPLGPEDSYYGFRVPYVMVNRRYIFFGKRTPRQLVWMIAEAMGKE
ncbi:MAG: hypothetical protein IJI25_12465 [Eubacterium sp.]|nr:hypothetical protein [Eubacterium sp.]